METREGYKKTEIGWIPEDWGINKLKTFSNLITKGTTPTTLGFSYQNNGINFVKVESINNYGQFIPKLFAHISEEANLAMRRSILHKNDLLFSIAGALGRVALVNDSILPANTNQALAIIRLDKHPDINRNYVMVFLNSQIIKNHISKISVQSAQSNLSLKDINNFPIPIPPLPEQQKIASILTTVDDKISSIDQQIQQTEQLKKGLMEKLLTEGIGHTEFKDTKIGRIPKGWDVVKFGNASNNFDSKRIPIKSEDRQNIQGKYPYYGAQGVIDYVNDFIFDGEYLLIAEDGENVKSRKNDIAFIVNGRFWVNNHAHIVQSNSLSILEYLRFVLNFINIKEYVTGMAQPKLNKSKLISILIQLPPLQEQKQIATILSTVDNKIDVLQSKKTSYTTLKKGLMAQLLTGKMRVKI